jgi:two-component system, response regulator RegA
MTKGKLLIVDDDVVLATRLGKAMEKRDYTVQIAHAVDTGLDAARMLKPDYALLDLRLADGSGLDLVTMIKKVLPECRIIMMTAYGNIATAVSAIKQGAVDYLPKPADADAIEQALQHKKGDHLPPPPANPMPADRIRWEHIQRIYEQCDRNVSETARRLQMHRRTLQRILAKYAPKESEIDQAAD